LQENYFRTKEKLIPKTWKYLLSLRIAIAFSATWIYSRNKIGKNWDEDFLYVTYLALKTQIRRNINLEFWGFSVSRRTTFERNAQTISGFEHILSKIRDIEKIILLTVFWYRIWSSCFICKAFFQHSTEQRRLQTFLGQLRTNCLLIPGISGVDCSAENLSPASSPRDVDGAVVAAVAVALLVVLITATAAVVAVATAHMMNIIIVTKCKYITKNYKTW
jgi:hypothetical protein